MEHLHKFNIMSFSWDSCESYTIAETSVWNIYKSFILVVIAETRVWNIHQNFILVVKAEKRVEYPQAFVSIFTLVHIANIFNVCMTLKTIV